MSEKITRKLTSDKILTYLIGEMALLMLIAIVIAFLVVSITSSDEKLHKSIPYATGLVTILMVYSIVNFVRTMKRDLTEDELEQIK